MTEGAVPRRTWLRGVGAAAITGALGCQSRRPRVREASRTTRVWAHQGQESENAALRGIAAAFGRAHESSGGRVELTFFPDHHYTERLAIAAAAHDMPDAFELDGPLVARFVDAGLVAPLDAWFSPGELDDFLPTVRAQGTIGGRIYALGAFDSATVLYYDRRLLESAGVSLPSGAGFAWPELLVACERLAASGVQPLALHMGESADEWFSYAFSPVVWSGGGRLIDSAGQSVRGILASKENTESLHSWQLLFERGFALRDPVNPDPFGIGTAAMDWSGHWMARSHLASKGGALGVMALPRVGPAHVSACGSYCWAVYAGAKPPEAAVAWLRWVTDVHQGIQPIVAANGAVPGRRSAFAAFPEYRQLPYALFREQLESVARLRPRTPFYATLTRHFAAALRDIAHGAAVGPRLQRAERDIEAVITRRNGFRREVGG